jgi:beta-lactamase class A
MIRHTLTHVIAAVLVAPALALAMPVMAQETAPIAAETPETAGQSALEMRSEQVIALLNGDLDVPLEEVFTAGFLAAVPPAQLAAISEQFLGQFGAALAVESLGTPQGTRSALAIRMERAIARGGLAIDPADDNRISELLFQSFDPLDDSLAKIEADLAALPGNVSAYFGPRDGSDPVISIAPDNPMAIGSTFKLYVLAALARQVEQGARSWDDVIALETKSFPSGMMQNWPQGSPVTLYTLASMMISISDNTATDQLIAVLGREAVTQAMVDSGHSAPELNDPFMTTRELFLLKGGPVARLETYSNADAGVRAQILEGIEDEPVSADEIQAAFASGPNAIDLEWFASTQDLAALFTFMRETADLQAFDVMAINRSVADGLQKRWPYAGYKGGSEPGVLNLTWLLTDENGRDHVLSLSTSNAETNIEETTLELIAQRILSLVR